MWAQDAAAMYGYAGSSAAATQLTPFTEPPQTTNPGLLARQPDQACRRAEAWVQKLQHQGRPRALLQANRLLVACLGAAGRTDEAKQTLANIAAQCAELGLVRYLLDGGPELIAPLAALRDDLHSDRWSPTWPPVPSAFLDRILNAAQPISSGGAAPQARPN